MGIEREVCKGGERRRRTKMKVLATVSWMFREHGSPEQQEDVQEPEGSKQKQKRL